MYYIGLCLEIVVTSFLGTNLRVGLEVQIDRETV